MENRAGRVPQTLRKGQREQLCPYLYVVAVQTRSRPASRTKRPRGRSRFTRAPVVIQALYRPCKLSAENVRGTPPPRGVTYATPGGPADREEGEKGMVDDAGRARARQRAGRKKKNKGTAEEGGRGRGDTFVFDNQRMSHPSWSKRPTVSRVRHPRLSVHYS